MVIQAAPILVDAAAALAEDSAEALDLDRFCGREVTADWEGAELE